MSTDRHVTEDELQARCDALEAQLPALIAEYPEEGDFWSAFAGIADEIVEDAARMDNAGDYNAVYWLPVNARLVAMLDKHGIKHDLQRVG